MYLMAGLLAVGFACNLLVRPLPAGGGTTARPVAPEPLVSEPGPVNPAPAVGPLLARWAWVTVPLAWGVWRTAETSLALFR
jgi:hypothetical protein